MASKLDGSSSSDSDNSINNDDADVSTTLYFGNLHPFVQQRSLEDLCVYFGSIESAKVIKDKGTGASAGYGFVRFGDKKCADAALQALNGQSYLGEELRVNWALPTNHKEDTSHHHHVFVGDLSCDVTDAVLYNAFCTVGQCSDARVMWDHITSRSKGYGFVSFRRKEDAEAAVIKMQGKQLGTRRIRVGWAQHKQDSPVAPLDFASIDRADPLNTNVYIGNIAPETSEADMTVYFTAYGPVAEVKLHKKGGYGFVKYEAHASAVKAIIGQHGKELHGRALKCSWGKNNSSTRSSSASSALAAVLKGHQFMGAAPASKSPPMMPHVAAPNIVTQLAAAANALAATRISLGHHVPTPYGISQQQLIPPSGAGFAGLPGGASAFENSIAPNTQNMMPMYFNQANFPQVLPPINHLAAQMLLMQSQNDIGLHATMAAISTLQSSALTAGNMMLDPPAMGSMYPQDMIGYGGPGLYGDGFSDGSFSRGMLLP